MKHKQIFVAPGATWEFMDMVDKMASEANAVSLFDFDPAEHRVNPAAEFSAQNGLYAMEWGYFVAVGDAFEKALAADGIEYHVNNNATAERDWAEPDWDER